MLLGPLRRLLGADLHFCGGKVPDGNFNEWPESTEGTIHGTLKDEFRGKKTAVLVYLELKVGLGEGGLQAALSLRKFVSRDAVMLSLVLPDFLALTANC